MRHLPAAVSPQQICRIPNDVAPWSFLFFPAFRGVTFAPFRLSRKEKRRKDQEKDKKKGFYRLFYSFPILDESISGCLMINQTHHGIYIKCVCHVDTWELTLRSEVISRTPDKIGPTNANEFEIFRGHGYVKSIETGHARECTHCTQWQMPTLFEIA